MTCSFARFAVPGALALFLAVAAPIVALPSAHAAEPYSSAEFGFSIDFPTTPEIVANEVQTGSGTAKVARFKAHEGNIRASLTVVAFDRAAFSDTEAAYGLAQSRDRQIAQVKGTLVSETDLEVDDGLGKDLMIAFGPPEQNFRYRVRTYYIGSRQFLVSLVGWQADVVSAPATAYLDSFEPAN